jgi:hypothetical protein
MNKCPNGSIRSFPLKLGIQPSLPLYESADESFPLSIQWAQRTTPPVFFSVETGETDDMIITSNKTTVRYSGVTYTLASVQICRPSHQNWLLGTYNPSMNLADVIIIFDTDRDDTSYKYITLICPLIQSPDSKSSVSSPYINGLIDEDMTGPYSLRDCFPKDNSSLFVYYTTCLEGLTAGLPSENVITCFCIDGLMLDASIFEALLEKLAPPSGPLTTFPLFNTGYLVNTIATPTVLTNDSEFLQYCLTTRDLLNYSGLASKYKSPEDVTRSDAVDAYKCVPFDPDGMIVDGKISVNIETGVPLTQVNTERANLKNQLTTNFKWIPNDTIKEIASISLGVMFVFLLIFATIIGVVSFTQGKRTFPTQVAPQLAAHVQGRLHSPSKTSLLDNLKGSFMYTICAIVFMFFGLGIGYMLFYKKEETEKKV